MNWFEKQLLDWYDENKRKLPWRDSGDPYKILLSEIMLQQTQVETVRPKYELFLEKFPTVESLAHASSDQVLKMWEGLGYYRRAENLHKAAKIIAKNGRFPVKKSEWMTLPGVGEYTSGALASILHNEPVPAIDGNVNRVFARFYLIKHSLSLTKTKKEIYEKVIDVLSSDRPGDFNQALMDLGAMVCIPKGDIRCESCPLASKCLAKENGLVDILPVKEKAKKKKQKNKTVFLIEHENRLALQKRKNKGLLAGLYQLPNTSGLLDQQDAIAHLKKLGFDFDRLYPVSRKKHIFSHEAWDMLAYGLVVHEESPEYLWVDEQELEDTYSVPTAFRKFLDKK